MATLRELVTGKGYDASQGIIEEVLKRVPEIEALPSVLIPGTSFQSAALITDPTTGFRNVGAGIAASDEGYRLDTFNLGVLAGLVQRDKAAVDADIRGRDATMKAAATALVRSGMKSLAVKVFAGAKASAEKFDGCATLCKAALTVNAGGTAAESGDTGLSSVYALGCGEEACHLVFNVNSPLLTQSELNWEKGVMTGSNNKPVPSYWTDLTCWAGFACRNANAIARIANLSTAKPLTDVLLAELVSKYAQANDGQNPSALFVTFGQRLLLQKSRGTTVRTSAKSAVEITAAVPLEYDGIPIYATNALTENEELVS